MSVKALTWAFDVHAPSSGAKLALVALADSADDDGIVILGRLSLAAKCQVTPTTSTAHLKALEEAALIWRKERRRQNGSRTSDWIVLAPGATDRGPMADATSEKRDDPDLIQMARTTDVGQQPNSSGQDFSPEDSLGEVLPPGQVKKLGGPDPSGDPGLTTSVKKFSKHEELPPLSDSQNPTRGGYVQTVFDAWVESTGRTGRTVLSPKRQKQIRNALRDYPVGDLIDAVDGWRFSAHHRGENDRHEVYNDLELLLRDSAHIEKFRDLKRGAGRVATFPSPGSPAPEQEGPYMRAARLKREAAQRQRDELSTREESSDVAA